MATYTWAAASSAVFNTPNLWMRDGSFPGLVPGTADIALVAQPGSYTISSADQPSIEAFSVDTLVISAAGATLDIAAATPGNPSSAFAATIDNAGLIHVQAGATLASQGRAIPAGALVNSGSIQVDAGGHLGVGADTMVIGLNPFIPNGTLANTGAITLADGATLDLYATTTTATLNAIQHGAARFNLNGLIDNAGGTLSTAALGDVLLYGTIDGGTLRLDGGTLAFKTASFISRSLLRNTTIQGILPQGAYGLAGTIAIQDLSGSNPGTLSVSATDFNGVGTIAFGVLDFTAASDLVVGGPNSALTFAPGVSITTSGAGGTIRNAQTIYNQGTLIATQAFALRAQSLIVNEGTILSHASLELNPADGLSGNSTFLNLGLLAGGPGGITRITADTVQNDGTILLSGGSLALSGAVTGTGTIAVTNGATLSLRGADLQQPLLLVGTGNLLNIQAATGTYTIHGFTSGDTISLNGPLSVAFAGGTLTASAGTTEVARFLMPDVPANAEFQAAIDGSFNTTITETIPCFTQGTRIRTPRGDVPVEQLRPGDRVVSAFGGTVPIVWIGRRTLRPARHRDPALVQPIRIAAGALADNIPARDLLLSPEHALHLDSVLVPARHLLNGTTIHAEPRDTVTYFHIELPQHDVLLAENAPCESYLDTNNRTDFDQPGAPIAAHPGFTPDTAAAIWHAQACAPQCRGGRRLAAIRAAIAQRQQSESRLKAYRKNLLFLKKKKQKDLLSAILRGTLPRLNPNG